MSEAQKGHHYFGSTALFWTVGETRQEVIQKLAKRLSDNTGLLMAAQVAKQGGVYCWTCRVEAPIDAKYGIRNYAPEGINCSHTFDFEITSKKGDIRLTSESEKHLEG